MDETPRSKRSDDEGAKGRRARGKGKDGKSMPSPRSSRQSSEPEQRTPSKQVAKKDILDMPETVQQLPVHTGEPEADA